jgi:hypothetical protein
VFLSKSIKLLSLGCNRNRRLYMKKILGTSFVVLFLILFIQCDSFAGYGDGYTGGVGDCGKNFGDKGGFSGNKKNCNNKQNITVVTAYFGIGGAASNQPMIQFRTNSTPTKLTKLGFDYWYAPTNGTGTGTLTLTDTGGAVLASVNFPCAGITSAVPVSVAPNLDLLPSTDYQARLSVGCTGGGAGANLEVELSSTSSATIWSANHQYIAYGLLSAQSTPTTGKTIARFRTGNGAATVPSMTVTAYGDNRNVSANTYRFALTDEVGNVVCNSPAYICNQLLTNGGVPYIQTVSCGNAALSENTEYQLTVTSECLQTDGAGFFNTAINVVPVSNSPNTFATSWLSQAYTLIDTPPTSLGGYIGTFHTGANPMVLTTVDTSEVRWGTIAGTGTVTASDLTDASGTVLCTVTASCNGAQSGGLSWFSDWVAGCHNIALAPNSTYHWKNRTACTTGYSGLNFVAHVQNQAPSTPFTKFVFFGDSITAAQGTTFDNAHGQAQHSYATVLSQKVGGVPFDNWGVPGDQAGEADQMAFVKVDGGDNILYNIMIGANDQRWYTNLDANQRQLFREALSDMVHWLGSYSTVNHATYSVSGPTPGAGCTSTTALFPGTSKTPIISCGNSTPATFTISNLVGSQIWFSSQVNTPSSSTYNVLIDGASAGSFNTNSPSSVNVQTANGLIRYSRLLEFTGLSNAAHTLSITSANIGVGQSNNSFFYQWVGSSGEYRPKVKIVLDTVTTQSAGFGWGGSAANLALYNSDIAAVCAQAIADNINCVLADTNSATTVNDTMDGIHLTNNGHNKIANYLYPYFVTP